MFIFVDPMVSKPGRTPTLPCWVGKGVWTQGAGPVSILFKEDVDHILFLQVIMGTGCFRKWGSSLQELKTQFHGQAHMPWPFPVGLAIYPLDLWIGRPCWAFCVLKGLSQDWSFFYGPKMINNLPPVCKRSCSKHLLAICVSFWRNAYLFLLPFKKLNCLFVIEL